MFACHEVRGNTYVFQALQCGHEIFVFLAQLGLDHARTEGDGQELWWAWFLLQQDRILAATDSVAALQEHDQDYNTTSEHEGAGNEQEV